MGKQIQAFVFENFVPESSAVVQERLEDFSHQARELTIAGFAFLLVTAFMMLVTMEEAFNEIWQVAEPRRGHAALSRVLGRVDLRSAAGGCADCWSVRI